jgi:hypothetical protein
VNVDYHDMIKGKRSINAHQSQPVRQKINQSIAHYKKKEAKQIDRKSMPKPMAINGLLIDRRIGCFGQFKPSLKPP